MKLLLDECVTNYLKPDFADHEVFTVLILRAKTNTYPDLKPLVPQALAALDQIRPGEIVIVRP